MTLPDQLHSKYGNPLEWTSAKKASFLLDVYFVGQCVYFVSLFFALNSDALRPAMNLEQAYQHLAYFKLLLLFTLIAVAGIKIVSRSCKDCVLYEHIAAQFFAITHVYYGYTIGLMALPTGVVLAGVPVLGFIVFNRKVVVFSSLSAIITVILFSFATFKDILPYAPLAKSITQSNGQLEPTWMAVYIFFAAPLLVIIFAITYYVLHRWRLREEEVQFLSTTDSLTGLLNRRSIMERLEHAKEISEKTCQPLAVIMVDLDHFKQINDTWGHSIGDCALQSAANALKSTIRQHDFVGRYGGEEFLVILPGLEAEQAQILAERIRIAVADTKVDVNPQVTLGVTASLGMCCCGLGRKLSLEDLIKQADMALYKAKHDGRDKLVVAG